jgi:hypothetical protein
LQLPVLDLNGKKAVVGLPSSFSTARGMSTACGGRGMQ